MSSNEWIAGIFEPLIDSIEVGIYVLDNSGIVKRVNKFIVENYGWQAGELLGQNIFELMPDLAEAEVEKNFRRVVREGRATELTNLQRQDRLGRDVVYNLTGIPITAGGEIIGVLAVMNDITEKRTLQSEIAETREYLQNLIDNANDIIYTLDREGYITFINKLGQEITGYTFDPAEKTHYTDYIPKEDLAKSEKHFRAALTGKPQRHESMIVAMDGRPINMLVNTTPIRKGEEIVGVLGIARDITERKQMQAQLLQAGKLAAIGELAAGVAHEINNPVGIISGTAEQLQFLIERRGEHPEGMSQKFLKHVETIREQAARCERITQGLLNFARRTEISATEVNVANLVKEAVALLQNRAMTEGKRIEADVPDDLPALQADPHHLGQVFLNLVNNALDAVDKNGKVAIRVRVENNSIVVDVADNGTGIAEEDLKEIFAPFFTTKPIGKGTGLGLSICFGIVERMNGSISVKSKLGGGTTFTVRLPVERRKSTET